MGGPIRKNNPWYNYREKRYDEFKVIDPDVGRQSYKNSKHTKIIEKIDFSQNHDCLLIKNNKMCYTKLYLNFIFYIIFFIGLGQGHIERMSVVMLLSVNDSQ